MAIGHNGNLVNAEELRQSLERDGAVFQSTSDTEVIIHLLARAEGASLVDQLPRALQRVKGAFTLLVLTPDRMVGVRDPAGFRPLSLGRLARKCHSYAPPSWPSRWATADFRPQPAGSRLPTFANGSASSRRSPPASISETFLSPARLAPPGAH